MWIAHVGGKFHHGLLEKSLKEVTLEYASTCQDYLAAHRDLIIPGNLSCAWKVTVQESFKNFTEGLVSVLKKHRKRDTMEDSNLNSEENRWVNRGHFQQSYSGVVFFQAGFSQLWLGYTSWSGSSDRSSGSDRGFFSSE